MNRDMKVFLAILGTLFILGGAFALGASTVPSKTPIPTPRVSPRSTTKPATTVIKEDPAVVLARETEVVTKIITAKYPLAATDYIIGVGKLYTDHGTWYGMTLTYRGTDTMNRDTLRVLLQKKNGSWVLRTTPPEPLLSAQKYTDVPVAVLRSINKPVSLPGTDTSPIITPNE